MGLFQVKVAEKVVEAEAVGTSPPASSEEMYCRRR